jgi:hypothetical protein
LSKKVRIKNKGDFVENPENQCKTCGKHHITCEYQYKDYLINYKYHGCILHALPLRFLFYMWLLHDLCFGKPQVPSQIRLKGEIFAKV